mmetsp:Transcript_68355/g.221162  ORF Transcript_68355/g.221162 Transcript_68355/m.221162 type:complete len:258 (+) Transcript_68355:223-996(+)
MRAFSKIWRQCSVKSETSMEEEPEGVQRQTSSIEETMLTQNACLHGQSNSGSAGAIVPRCRTGRELSNALQIPGRHAKSSATTCDELVCLAKFRSSPCVPVKSLLADCILLGRPRKTKDGCLNPCRKHAPSCDAHTTAKKRPHPARHRAADGKATDQIDALRHPRAVLLHMPVLCVRLTEVTERCRPRHRSWNGGWLDGSPYPSSFMTAMLPMHVIDERSHCGPSAQWTRNPTGGNRRTGTRCARKCINKYCSVLIG